MFKFGLVPRIAYALLLPLLLAIILINTSCSTPAPGAAPAETPAAAEAEADQAGQEGDAEHQAGEEADAEQHDAEAEGEEEGLKFDHHGKPIREDPAYEKVVQDGVVVEFTVENFLGVGGRGGEVASEIFEGEIARLKFRISDAESEEPIPDLRPAAWMDLVHVAEHADEEDHSPAACQERVQGYLGGTLAARPDINLNSYFVLAMNQDAVISVIDPMVDVAGMTNLFGAIQLPKPGADWAKSGDQHHLFVTIPQAGQVTVADLEQFWAIKNLPAGANPTRTAFQPNEKYLWVGNDSAQAEESGVTVIDPQALEVVRFIPTGAGHHELAFSADSRYAFVTNSQAGSLSVIDTQSLELVQNLEVGGRPAALDVSQQNGAVYVADAASGDISVIDGQRLERVAGMSGQPGLAALRFAPGGRWGFAANPEAGQVAIFDATRNLLVYELPVDGRPDQITFSPTAAYIRTQSLPAVVLIPLADLAEQGTISVLTVPVGRAASSGYVEGSLASAVSTTPEEGGMVIASPGDDQVYYYLEGSQAPVGGFQGHTLRPRAVSVIDRSLREQAPGVYVGSVRVPTSGTYQVAFLLNSPRVVHCFEMTVKPSPELARERQAPPPHMEFLGETGQVQAGEAFKLQFTLTDPDSDQPVADLADVLALANQTAGNWNQRYVATALGDGRYQIELNLPQPGLYTLYFAIPSRGANFNALPSLTLKATVE